MKISAKAEFLGARKQDTKNKGEAVIITVMDEEVFEIWAFDDEAKKKAMAKKKGQEITLTWKVRKFKGYLQIGELVGVE